MGEQKRRGVEEECRGETHRSYFRSPEGNEESKNKDGLRETRLLLGEKKELPSKKKKKKNREQTFFATVCDTFFLKPKRCILQ